jgi:hypothetical protein
MWDMDYLAGKFEIDMPVYVYGLRFDRSEVVPQDLPVAPDGVAMVAYR